MLHGAQNKKVPASHTENGDILIPISPITHPIQ